jgi:sugar lactone lactonase YvrE
MRREFLKTALLTSALLATSFGAHAQGDTFPELVPLPDGFRPEGVALGYGHTLYAGSLADGSIYEADLSTGSGEILVPPQVSRIAVGLAFDRRSNLIFAAGGPAGAAYVYDGETGGTVAQYDITSAGDSFINDVVVTRDAAYVTNSFAAEMYRIPLGPRGELPGPGEVESVTLGGDWPQVPGFNANGIESTPNGKWLLIVHSTLGELFRVDPRTGEATFVDLGGASLSNGDGLVLAGRTLYVVRNRLNQIEVVELSRDLTSGEVVGSLTSPYFDVPTTIAGFGDALYAVNARFGTPPEPGTEYHVVRVLK